MKNCGFKSTGKGPRYGKFSFGGKVLSSAINRSATGAAVTPREAITDPKKVVGSSMTPVEAMSMMGRSQPRRVFGRNPKISK